MLRVCRRKENAYGELGVYDHHLPFANSLMEKGRRAFCGLVQNEPLMLQFPFFTVSPASVSSNLALRVKVPDGVPRHRCDETLFPYRYKRNIVPPISPSTQSQSAYVNYQPSGGRNEPPDVAGGPHHEMLSQHQNASFSNATSPANHTDLWTPVAGWQSGGRDRGTIDILWSSCVTVVLCIWVSTSPNALAPTDKWYHGLIDKFHLAVTGLLGPEFLLGIAAGHLANAGRSVKVNQKSFLVYHARFHTKLTFANT